MSMLEHPSYKPVSTLIEDLAHIRTAHPRYAKHGMVTGEYIVGGDMATRAAALAVGLDQFHAAIHKDTVCDHTHDVPVLG